MAKVKKPIAVLPGVWEHDAERVCSDTLPSGAGIRLTVGWLSGYQKAHYKYLINETILHAIEKYGVSPNDLREDEEPLSAISMMVQSWYERSIMLSSLRKVEVEQNGEWIETKLPASWWEIDNFRFVVPEKLHDEWLSASLDTNPQIFGSKQSEPEKKDEPPVEIASPATPNSSLTPKKKRKKTTTGKNDLPPSS